MQPLPGAPAAMVEAMSRRSGTSIIPNTAAVAVCVARVASSQIRSMTAAFRLGRNLQRGS